MDHEDSLMDTPLIVKMMKEDKKLPDNYAIKLFYLTGKTEEFEIASHAIHDKTKVYRNDGFFEEKFEGKIMKYNLEPSPNSFLEIVTSDDQWHWIPLSSVERIEFDKRFSKIISLKKEMCNN